MSKAATESIAIDRGEFRPSYRPAKPASSMDAGTIRMGLMAAGIGGGLALLFGGAMLYQPAHHGVPVIEPEAGPVRVKPENPGGMTVSGADLGAGVAGQGPHLAPAAEQPEIATLRKEVRKMKREMDRQAAENALLAKQSEENKRLAMLAAVEAAHPKLIAGPAPVQRATATARIAMPVEAPPAAGAPSGTLSGTPSGTPSGTNVQLAAFADEAAARTEWEALVKRVPELLGGRAPEVSRTEVAGRVMWRLRTGGFSTLEAATGFCAKMRARGEECSIAAF